MCAYSNLDNKKITYHYSGYTNASLMLIDLARVLDVSMSHAERFMLVLDWNYALSGINTIRKDYENT